MEDDNKNNIKIILKAIEAKDLLSADFNGLSDLTLKYPTDKSESWIYQKNKIEQNV